MLSASGSASVDNIDLGLNNSGYPAQPHPIIVNNNNIFRVDIHAVYQHEWKLGKREIVWKHDARRAECFHTISSFPNTQ
jgi:hypothetical protein